MIKLFSKSADTLVLLEGIGANLKGWDLFVEDFAKEFNVVRYDHPCSGKSILHHSKPLSHNDFFDSLESVLSEIRGNIHLVGYSLGGFIASRYLLEKRKHSEKIKALTVGAGFIRFTEELLNGLKATKNELLSLDARSAHIKSFPYLYDEKSLKDKVFHDYLVNRCINDADFITSENFIKQIDACLNAHEWQNPPPATEKCSVPLLLMFSNDDKIIHPEWTLEIKEYFANVTTHEFEHGGHCFKDVHRKEFVDNILKYIIDILIV